LRFILILLAGLFLYISWPALEQELGMQEPAAIESLKSEYTTSSEPGSLTDSLNHLTDEFSRLTLMLKSTIGKLQEQNGSAETEPSEPAELTLPSERTFSFGNVELGDTKEAVEERLGSPVRSTLNEYGTEWHAYHQDYRNFLMLAYDENNQVAGVYTNQDLISSTNGIQYGSPEEYVRSELGESIDKINKGFTVYQLNEDRDYDLYQLDGSYVSIFYDQHEANTVTAIQVISETLENQRQDFYPEPSKELKEGYELQLFDLTNAARVRHGHQPLQWDEEVRVTARRHSTDMAENNYFNHTNLEGQSPFDRMAEDNITFSVAGENLAYGQSSSIFAHEGLMNSLGHRENILKPDFRLLGVGVDFNSHSQPYYTQKFYSKM
jgi:uncharacterized protein YkwD